MARPNTAAADSLEETMESLQQSHQSLQERLAELDRLRSLSPEEQFEVQIIKKRKLALKDRIQSIQSSN